MRVYLFVFFPGGDRIDQVVLECCERAHSNGNESSGAPFVTKFWCSFIFPKSTDQNSEIAILFSVVKKPRNYVFGDESLPRSPRGRGYKLQTLTSAYI